MRTVSIFKNGKNQAIRLPKELEFKGITKLEITKHGDAITLRPAHPNWLSLADYDKANHDFMQERPDVVQDEGRFSP
jgi:antitoxin VapB